MERRSKCEERAIDGNGYGERPILSASRSYDMLLGNVAGADIVIG